jgi:hypothetical protein
MTMRDQTTEGKALRRRAHENAVLAFRPEVADEHYRTAGIDLPKPKAAVDAMAGADVPRVLKHRAVIDGFLRLPAEGGDRTSLRDSAVRVLSATGLRDRSREKEARGRLTELLDQLLDAPSSALTDEHWKSWVANTEDVFDLTVHEKTYKTECNDSQEVYKYTPSGERVPSRRIVAQFWSDLPPSAFTRFVDPQHWPEISAFWTGMKKLSTPVLKTDPPTGYDCKLEETVVLLGTEIKVPLQVAYRERPDRVWVRFNLDRKHYTAAVPVDVDTGTVSAESTPGGPARTLVQSTKYVHWTTDHPDFSNLSCDFGYADLMAEMAQASLDDPKLAAVAATTPAVPVGDAVTRFVTDVTRECKDGVDGCAPPLRSLVGRFTGTSWNAGWINDLLDIGKVQVDHYGNVASHVRRLADSMRDAGIRKDDHG